MSLRNNIDEDYKKAINGLTGIECFDDWVKEIETETRIEEMVTALLPSQLILIVLAQT